MTDDPLARLWAETEAPARDFAFELAVEEAVARRRLAREAALWLGGALLAGGALWAAWPGIAPVIDAMAAPFAAAAQVLGLAGAAAVIALGLARSPLMNPR